MWHDLRFTIHYISRPDQTLIHFQFTLFDSELMSTYKLLIRAYKLKKVYEHLF